VSGIIVMQEIILGNDRVDEVIAGERCPQVFHLVSLRDGLAPSDADQEELSQIRDARVEKVC
jgi:hypothetical protein